MADRSIFFIGGKCNQSDAQKKGIAKQFILECANVFALCSGPPVGGSRRWSLA